MQRVKTSHFVLLLLPVLCSAQPYPSVAFGLSDPDGILSLETNPAGLATMHLAELAVQSGGAQPMGQDLVRIGSGGFAVGWDRTKAGTTVQRSQFRLGYGTWIHPSFAVGISAIRQKIDSIPTGWSADLGLQWQPSDRLAFGWLLPNIRGRDGSRSTGNRLGMAVRPRGAWDVQVGLETYLLGAAWLRSAWDFPVYEAALRIRPFPWLSLDTRVDPQALSRYSMGIAVQLDPALSVFSRSVPALTGPEFHSAGLRFSREAFPSATSTSATLLYRLPANLTESGKPRWFGSTQAGLPKLREDFRQIARTAGIQKVVIHFGRTKLSPTTAGILHRQILELRRSGLEVLAWTQDLDYATLYAASASDRMAMSPDGSVHVRGLGMDLLFFGKTLGKLGIQVQVAKTGAWKSAMETWQSDRMSPPARENLERFLRDLDSTMMAGIVGSRKLDAAAFLRFVDSASLLPKRAKAAGLVDTLVLESDLRKWAGVGRQGWSKLELKGEHDIDWGAKKQIAIVPIQGQIVDHRGEAGMTPWSASLPAEEVAATLDALGADASVAGVVLRVGSPGGAVSGSERLRRAVEKLAAKKPVGVSIGSTCASGAYLLSLPAGRIFSEPEAVVGSIGAFAAKVSIQGLLDSLGIGVERLRTAPHAGAASPYGPLDSTESLRLSEFVKDAHVEFGGHVRKWRKMDSAAFERVDGGRIFSGSRAAELGLVDTLGDLAAAVRWTSRKAKLAGEPTVFWQNPVRSTGLSGLSRLAQTLDADRSPLTELSDRILPLARTSVWAQASWEPLWQ